MNQYLDEAKKQLEGGYASRLAELQRQRDLRMSEYDTTVNDTNKSYDNSLEQNRVGGVHRVNNYNNNTLTRGLGRSTIATTGIAGIENQTAKMANDIGLERQSKLADIDRARKLYLEDVDRSSRTLEAEKLSEMQKFAYDMYNRDLDYERQQAAARARAASQAAAQREAERQYNNTVYKNDNQKSMYDYSMGKTNNDPWGVRMKKLYQAAEDPELSPEDRAFANAQGQATRLGSYYDAMYDNYMKRR